MSQQARTIDDDTAIPEDIHPRQSQLVDDILWSDPEKTLRRPHVAVASVAAHRKSNKPAGQNKESGSGGSTGQKWCTVNRTTTLNRVLRAWGSALTAE